MESAITRHEDTVRLPKHLQEFKGYFPDFNSGVTPFTPKQHILTKYSGNALRIGRPLDSVMVLMAGDTGSGKSSTINALFDDNHLCETSDNRSATKHVTIIKKTIEVLNEAYTIQAPLCFVDIPGVFDTDNDDATNLAKFRMFTNECAQLSDRPDEPIFVRRTVYPNIILFVVNANDNRMMGPNSSLVKSMNAFKAEGLIDYMHNNVIVVLTHALSMAQNKERFLKMLCDKTALIQSQFYKHLQILNVAVIPVENNPTNFDLEQVGDFYKLPNGQLSPLNLYRAIERCLQYNEDTLGNLLVSYYFSPSCPEKNVAATVSKLDQEPNTDALEQAALDLQRLGIVTTLPEDSPVYHFHSLGYGFCPVTETVKHMFPFKRFEQLRSVHIEKSTFSIPTCVDVYKARISKFHRLTFFGKDEYQKHVKGKYGIDVKMGFLSRAKSEGTLIAEEKSAKEDSRLSLLQEVGFAKLSLRNPEQLPRNSYFQRDLDNLPDTYDKGPYEAFFSKWGTHFIVEETVGGAIHMNCTVAKGHLKIGEMEKLDANVSGILGALIGHNDNARLEYNSNVNRLRQMGISKEQLRLEGGIITGFTSLENPNFDELKCWSESVAQNPSELKCSVKIIPYYDLLEFSPKCNVLRAATESYLNDGANDIYENSGNRQLISAASMLNILGAAATICFLLAKSK